MKKLKLTLFIIITMILTSIGYSQNTPDIVGEWKEGPNSVHILIFKEDGSFSEQLMENYVRHGTWKTDNGQIIIDHTVTPAYAVYTTTVYEKYEVKDDMLKLFRTDVEYDFIKVSK